MKRLWLFCGIAFLLLGSASPPLPPALELDASIFSEADCVERDSCDVPLASAPRLIAERVDDGDEIAVTATLPPVVADAVLPAEEPKKWTPRGVRVVVSLPQQKAYVFEDGDLLATSPVSTGKPGHRTPVGTFRILQKKVHHRSSKYDNAPMPYMQRLTSYGIALHAGKLPGYPASHGCIRLPWSFAKKLYALTDHSTRVTVTNARPKSAKEALTLA
jgi:hypothetical protein